MSRIAYSLVRQIALFLALLLYSTSCTVAQEAQPSTPTDLTATMQMVPMSTATVPPTQGILPQREPTKTPWPVPTPTGSLSPTTTPTGTPSLLQGPLIAFRVQNDSNYLLLFEPATSTLREIRGDILEYAFRLQWLDRGCRLYVRGQVIDLHGNVTEQLANNRDASELFNMSLLSPDWEWGVVEHFSGFHEGAFQELEYLTLELVNRNDLAQRLSLAPNGGAYAYAWSPDGRWLAFSDFDERQILQVYRATPEGDVEQLTFHTEQPGVINLLAWSPDGQHLAYAASTLLSHQFEQRQTGWVGLITLLDLEVVRAAPHDFTYAEGLWWSRDSSHLLLVGESLPTNPDGTALQNTQIHWVEGVSGTIVDSFYQTQAPTQFLNLVTPLGDIDQIFFAGTDGYYVLDGETHAYEKISGELETHGLIRDFMVSPFDFPGEGECIE